MINRKCKCGGHICSYINTEDLAECCDCHKCYILKDGEFKKVSKSEFRIIHRQRLIDQQNSNKLDKLLYTKKSENQKWGCGCVIIKDGKMLLGKRCKKNDLPQWCFVGGSIEVGETPIDGVNREIQEESNLTALTTKFVEAYEKDNVIDFLFICTDFVGEPKPQEGELSELGWFTIEEVKELPLFPYTIESLKILEDKNIV